jgi:hypothetical protein
MSEAVESRFQNLHEFVTQARINLDRNNWDYLIGGSETETTLARNRLAFDAIGFRPRVLRDVSNIDCSQNLFGKKLRIPVLCAPVGSLEVFEAGGGATVAAATREFGNGMISSPRSRIQAWTGPPRRRATASRSSSFMYAATPPGSTNRSRAPSTAVMTRFASPSTPTAIRGASATSPSAICAAGCVPVTLASTRPSSTGAMSSGSKRTAGFR